SECFPTLYLFSVMPEISNRASKTPFSSPLTGEGQGEGENEPQEPHVFIVIWCPEGA
ncbi:MAG: hypothetical protein PWP04_1269, partial [Candidatus Atribacteria bacterium]|nr:hypothetical protein [Candidatus Atribacteria bacterium]